MRMDLFGVNRTSPEVRSSDSPTSSSSSSSRGGWVVAIECVAGSSKADEWNENMVGTGDVVEEIRIGGEGGLIKAPFKNGKAGLQKLLHSSYKKGETSVWVRVWRRGFSTVNSSSHPNDTIVDLNACIVPQGGSSSNKRNYVLRSIRDPNYAISFVDRLERECLDLQGSKSLRVARALGEAQLQDGYMAYAWEKKMKESLLVPRSSSFFSLLLLPKSTDASNSRYNSLEDTLARANAWINCAQASGVPIAFLSVQTEPLLTKISGETASSTVNAGSLADLSNIANSSLYGFEDYHGVDIGVVKAVRLWYTAVAEFPLEIQLFEGETKLGFSISRTDEGFIVIGSVAEDDDVSFPSTRSGLCDIYRKARSAGKCLVISRISNEKVLPWMVSPSGAIRCFDTVSISQKLSLHRHALCTIQLHLLLWDMEMLTPISSRRSTSSNQLPIFIHPSMEQISGDTSLNDGSKVLPFPDGEASFRFHDLLVSDYN